MASNSNILLFEDGSKTRSKVSKSRTYHNILKPPPKHTVSQRLHLPSPPSPSPLSLLHGLKKHSPFHPKPPPSLHSPPSPSQSRNPHSQQPAPSNPSPQPSVSPPLHRSALASAQRRCIFLFAALDQRASGRGGRMLWGRWRREEA